MSLKTIIEAQGRKQSWIAREIGISEDALSRIVLGKQKLPLDKAEPLATVLGISVIELIRAIPTQEPA